MVTLAFGKMANKLDEMAAGLGKGLGKANAKTLGKHIDNVIDFSNSSRFAKDYDINRTYDAATGLYKNGADWGKDALGDTTPLRDMADTAGGLGATGLRGTAGGIKAMDDSTEAEDPEDRHN